MTIEKDISDAINKNLSAQVGERLRKELEQLEQLRTQAQQKDSQLTSLRNEIQSKDRAIERLELQAKHNGDLVAREAKVIERERKMDLIELELKLANERRLEFKGLVDTIFRSPVFERRVNGLVPLPLDGSPGGNGYCASTGFVGQGSVDVTMTEARR